MPEPIQRVHFAPNIQQQIALADLDAVPFGEFEWQYQLIDGRVLRVHADLAAKINGLELRIGEQFCICKRWNGQRAAPVRWDLWKTGDSEKQRAREEAPEIARQLRQPPDDERLEGMLKASLAQVEARKNAGNGNGHSVPTPESRPFIAAPSGNGNGNGNGRSGSAPANPRAQAPPPQRAALSTPNQDDPPAAYEQSAMAHFPWCQFLLSQTEALTDVFVAVKQYAGKRYGTQVDDGEISRLLITAFINLRGGANAA